MAQAPLDRSVRILTLALAAPFVVTLAACEDEVGLNRASGRILADEVIDFGNVQVGIIETREIEVKNEAGVGIDVTETVLGPAFTDQSYLFDIEEKTFGVGPNGTKKIKVTFQPLIEMEMPVETSLTFKSDLKDATGTLQSVTVRLRGLGIRTGLLVEPNPIEFGAVLVGTSRTMDVKITNLLSVPVDVKTRINGTQSPIRTTGGHGRFDLLTTLRPDGSILPIGTMLLPTESYTVQISYTPDPSDMNRSDFGTWVISNCDNTLCDMDVTMGGHGTNTGIECMPGAVEFGDINPGRSLTRTVTCTNISTGPIDVASWQLAMNVSEFSVTPFPMATPPVVGPGEMFKVDTTFSPTFATLGIHVTDTLVISSRSESANLNLEPVQIPLGGTGGGPTINVLPAQLDFGRIAMNTSYAKPLLVENTGYSDLIVTMVDTDGADAAMYAADRNTFVLTTGSSTVVNVTFSPSVDAPTSAGLLIHSNDGSFPVFPVPLSGIGVALPPCNYTVMPSNVSFGVVPARQTVQQDVRIQNNGTEDCLVNDVAITGDPSFVLINGNETGLVIPGGASKDIPVTYTPPIPGNHTGLLGFYISDPANSTPTIPLFGVGLAQTEITCPPAVTTPAGTPVTLTVQATTAGTTITSYDWAIINGPNGGIGTPGQWSPDPPRAQTETFLAHIVGVYDIHVTVMDDAGNSLGCDTQVTAEGHGLRVQLTWNGSGDIDLHLHNGNTTTPWFGGGDDCYYGNSSPLWNPAQAGGTFENPLLDFDNTVANGPENTRIDTVVVNQGYTIGVHNYSSGAGRIATIEIFCGGVTSPTSTFTSPVLSGSSAGNCSGNDFWKVATVTFSSQTACTVTPINTITASSNACISF